MACPVWLFCLLIASTTHQASWSLSITECDGSWLTISETSVQTITCGPVNPNEDLQWLLFNDSGLTRSAFCTTQHCNASEELVLSMGNGTHRTLTIVNNTRALANNGQVICLAGQISATCKINVIHPANLTDCTIHRTFTPNGGDYFNNYFVHGRCHFTGAYSSNGTYKCLLLDYQPGFRVPGTSRYSPGILSRNGSSGWCDVHFTWIYGDRYSVVVFPGDSFLLHVFRGPLAPVTNCSLTTIIAEGDDLVCACQANPQFLGAGFPPAVGVKWNDANAGPPVDFLMLSNVTRVDVERYNKYPCFIYQGTQTMPNIRSTYVSLIVAYGPDEVTLHVDRERLSDDGTLVLICSAFTFNPDVVFTWSGVHCDSILYEGNNSFCVIAQPHLVVEQTVTCHAANSAFQRIMKQASVALSLVLEEEATRK